MSAYDFCERLQVRASCYYCPDWRELREREREKERERASERASERARERKREIPLAA